MNQAAVDKRTARIEQRIRAVSASQHHDTIKMAHVPKGRPADKIWHVVRDRIVDDVYMGLSKGDEPRLVGLAGRSGSGKTTCAASIVGEPSSNVVHKAGESREQAMQRLNRVQVFFCDGIIWLRVGQGAGAPDRLPGLMDKLAKAVHEDIAGSRGFAPGSSLCAHTDGSSFVHDVVTQSSATGERLRCIVIADDVWEVEVLEELRKTGMWVLFTTRDPGLVKLSAATLVAIDELTESEAETLLRGAAELPAGSRLPSAARGIIERCDRIANHLEFVGRWSHVIQCEDSGGWEDALAAINAEMDAICHDRAAGVGEEMDAFGERRIAIFRAGFADLVAQDPANKFLYLALAVTPDGHAFEVKEAAVLLFDDWDAPHRVKKAGKVVGFLEQWAVVRMEGALFRMHDAHVDFARKKLSGDEPVRRPVVRRWCNHLATLDAIRCVEHFALVDLWRAVELQGGESWRVSYPYHKALEDLGDSDPTCLPSLDSLVDFGIMHSEWAMTVGVARRLLRLQQSTGGYERNIRGTLVCLIHCANALDLPEADGLRSHLSAMIDSAWSSKEAKSNPSDARQAAAELVGRGMHLNITGRYEESYESFLEALDIQKGSSKFSRMEIASTLESMAVVLTNLKLHDKAVEAYRECVAIKEEVGHEDLDLSVALHNLVGSLWAVGDKFGAENYFRRALAITESKVGADNLAVVRTIAWLA